MSEPEQITVNVYARVVHNHRFQVKIRREDYDRINELLDERDVDGAADLLGLYSRDPENVECEDIDDFYVVKPARRRKGGR